MFNNMFDELKEVNYFKEITGFKSLIIWNTFKEIKPLQSLQNAEAYLRPKRISTMDIFCEYT